MAKATVRKQTAEQVKAHLKGYVDDLDRIIDKYKKEKDRIEEFYNGDAVEEARRAVDENIKNVKKAIRYTNKHMDIIEETVNKTDQQEQLFKENMKTAIDIAINASKLS